MPYALTAAHRGVVNYRELHPRRVALTRRTYGDHVYLHLLAGTALPVRGQLLLFGSSTLVALVYLWREVPETKDRSLQELEQDPTG